MYESAFVHKLMTWVLAACGSVLAMFGWHYKKTVSRVEQLDNKQDNLQLSITELQTKMTHVHECVHRIETECTKAVDRNTEKLDKVINILHDKKD